MTWRGCDPAIEITSIDDLRAYIRSLDYDSWRPSNFVVHNTASPTLEQWWNSVPPAERVENLRDYYEQEMGWSAGPHCFIDGKSWWIFTEFNVKGVHSPSWNGTMLGFEHVGDYDTESATSGMGAEVQRMGHELSALCCEFFGWNPENLKFHYEDPNTDHACPGSNMQKPVYIDQVQQVMGEGGDAEQPSLSARRGTVYGLSADDALNIRAASSSSSPIIGEAENGDEVTVVGEAWNGSTQWLRIQFGRSAGPGVAVFGWASAQYISIEGEQAPVNHKWMRDIETTVFSGAEGNNSAYPPYEQLNDEELFVALPDTFEGERPSVIVRNRATGLQTIAKINDKGPWMVTDDYWNRGARPIAETCYKSGTPLPSGPNEGDVPTNGAGLDVSLAVAEAIGLDGKGQCDWCFVTTRVQARRRLT